jgi:FkbM family methyltransferase
MNKTILEEEELFSSFGKNYNFERKKIHKINKYNIFGTTIDYLIFKKILVVSDYIKIDVDRAEHDILQGAKKILKKYKIKSVLAEFNENFLYQKINVEKILRNCSFI